MTKTVIREIIIFLLLLVSIALLLGVILYDYIPNTKEIPSNVAPYALSKDIQEELEAALGKEEERIIKTYSIDSTDLSVYESTNQYDKGKINPFGRFVQPTPAPGQSGTNNNTSGNTTNNNTSTNTNTNTNTTNNTGNNVGNVFQEKEKANK